MEHCLLPGRLLTLLEIIFLKENSSATFPLFLVCQVIADSQIKMPPILFVLAISGLPEGPFSITSDVCAVHSSYMPSTWFCFGVRTGKHPTASPLPPFGTPRFSPNHRCIVSGQYLRVQASCSGCRRLACSTAEPRLSKSRLRGLPGHPAPGPQLTAYGLGQCGAPGSGAAGKVSHPQEGGRTRARLSRDRQAPAARSIQRAFSNKAWPLSLFLILSIQLVDMFSIKEV